MASIRRSRTIAAKPQAIWEVLADFGSLGSWAKNVDHSCLLEQGSGGGAIGTARRVQVGRNTVVERITEFDPPHLLGYDVEGLPRQLRRVHNCWQLAQSGDAARPLTTVSLTSTVEIGSNPLQHLAERAACRLIVKESEALLAGLAKRMERFGG